MIIRTERVFLGHLGNAAAILVSVEFREKSEKRVISSPNQRAWKITKLLRVFEKIVRHAPLNGTNERMRNPCFPPTRVNPCSLTKLTFWVAASTKQLFCPPAHNEDPAAGCHSVFQRAALREDFYPRVSLFQPVGWRKNNALDFHVASAFLSGRWTRDFGARRDWRPVIQVFKTVPVLLNNRKRWNTRGAR